MDGKPAWDFYSSTVPCGPVVSPTPHFPGGHSHACACPLSVGGPRPCPDVGGGCSHQENRVGSRTEQVSALIRCGVQVGRGWGRPAAAPPPHHHGGGRYELQAHPFGCSGVLVWAFSLSVGIRHCPGKSMLGQEDLGTAFLGKAAQERVTAAVLPCLGQVLSGGQGGQMRERTVGSTEGPERAVGVGSRLTRSQRLAPGLSCRGCS